MKKYVQIMSLEWKNAIIYRTDTALSALFSVFTVVLAYLLWSAVFGSREIVDGFTLPQMVTYYLLSKIVSPFSQGGGIQNEFSDEIKSGAYSKYIVKPISPLGYFVFASFARMILPVLLNTIVMAIAMISFPQYFLALHPAIIITAIPVLLLSGILSMLIDYLIAMSTFKLTDISFIYILKNIFTMLLSGGLIPLNMLLGDKIAMWSPFSYIIYYPVMLCMGKTNISIFTAIGVISVWIAILILVARFVQHLAPKAFEGVGI